MTVKYSTFRWFILLCILVGLMLCIPNSATIVRSQGGDICPAVIDTIPVGDQPVGIAVNENTNIIYVTNKNSDTISVIDGVTNTVTDTLTVGSQPSGIAVNPNTNLLYVANTNSDSISVIDGATNTIADTITVGDQPSGIAVNSSTNFIYVANTNSQSVSVIDGITHTIVDSVAVGYVNNGPVEIVVNPNTNRIYVLLKFGPYFILDGTNNTIIDSVEVIYGTSDIAINATTNRIYLTDLSEHKLTINDELTNATITSIPFGTPQLMTLAVNPSTDRIYVAKSSPDIAVIDGATNTVVNTADLVHGYGYWGYSPYGIAVNANTNRVYMVHTGLDWLYIIDDEIPCSTPIPTSTPSSTPTNTLSPTVTNTPAPTHTKTLTPTATATPGPVSPTNTQLQLLQSRAPADGLSPLTLKVTARAADGRTIPGAAVLISALNSYLVFTAMSGTTDSNGVFTTQITSDTVTTGEVHVSVDAVYIGRVLADFQLGDIAVDVYGYPSIVAGQSLVYTVRVNNVGLAASQNISVLAGLPFGATTYVSETHPNDVQFNGQAGNQVSWFISELQPNDPHFFTVVARASSTLALTLSPDERLTFGALASASSDVNTTNNEKLTQTSIVATNTTLPASDAQNEKLGVAYTANVPSALPGETVALTVRATNLTANETLYNVEGFATLRGVYPALVFTWPDAQQPGRLLPGQFADATFVYTVPRTSSILSIPQLTAWVKAKDSTLTDESIDIIARDVLDGFTIDGPHLLLQFIADKQIAYVGDTVTYTVYVTNAFSTDSATALTVTDSLTGTTHALVPAGDLAPSHTASATFSYVVQTSDIPSLTNWVTLTGHGVTYPDAVVELSARHVATVTTTTGGTLDLSVNANTVLSYTVPEQTFALPLYVNKAGTDTAQDVVLKLTLPPQVTVVDEVGGTYNAQTRQLTWTWGSLSTDTGVTPLFSTSAEIGSVLEFDASVSTSSTEAQLDNNATPFSVTVQASVPTLSTIALVDPQRSYIIADGQDSVEVRVTANDQMGNLMPDVTVDLSTTVTGLTITPMQATTDANGEAIVTLTATEPGNAEIAATIDNAKTVTLALLRRPNAVYLDVPELTVGVGGTGTLPILVTNTKTVNDRFTMQVTSDPSLNATWLQFQPSALSLTSGWNETTKLKVNIPSGSCTAVGDYTLNIQASGTVTGLLSEATAILHVVAAPPEVTNVLPKQGSALGSDSVLFSWRSATPGTHKVFVREQGASGYLEFTLLPNADDPTLYSQTVTLPIGNFEWYGEVSTPCGNTTIASDTAPRTFQVTNAVVFTNRDYTFTVTDGYDLVTDVNNNAMTVSIANNDTVEHLVTVTTDNAYPDLILGFTGEGSLDQALRLGPGETANLMLHVFTQEIQQTNYAISLGLTADGTTDSVPLTVNIQRPTPNIAYQLVNLDPNTRVATARLINQGATVTDLDFNIVQETSLIPANFSIQPDLHHVYLQAGQTIEFTITPLSLDGQMLVNADGSISSMPQGPTGPYKGYISVGDEVVSEIDSPATTNCIPNFLPYVVPINTPVTDTYHSASWYCTNKPNIDIPMTLSRVVRPDTEISNVQLSMTFSPGSGTAYSHTTSVLFNSNLISSFTVEGTQVQPVSLTVPPAYFVYGSAQQNISIRSLHPFGQMSHYTQNSEVSLTITLDKYSCLVCAANATAAQTMCGLQQEPTMTPTPAVTPPPLPLRTELPRPILFASDATGNMDIYLRDKANVTPINLTNDPADDWSPMWSFDARQIAFFSNRGGQPTMYVADIAGNTVTNVQPFDPSQNYGLDGKNPRLDWGPVWSPISTPNNPNGVRVAFMSYRDGNWEIYTMNIADNLPLSTRRSIRLTNNNALEAAPVWSHDGTKLAFVSDRDNDGDFEIYVIDSDGQNEQQLVDNNALNWSPIWSNDGQSILFSSKAHGASEWQRFVVSVTGNHSVIPFDINATLEWGPIFTFDNTDLMTVSQFAGELTLIGKVANQSLQQFVSSSSGNIQSPSWRPPIFTNIDFYGSHKALLSTMFFVMFQEGSNNQYSTGHIATTIDTLFDKKTSQLSSFLTASPYCDTDGNNAVNSEPPNVHWSGDVDNLIDRVEHCATFQYMFTQAMINGFMKWEREPQTSNGLEPYDANNPAALMGTVWYWFARGQQLGNQAGNTGFWTGRVYNQKTYTMLLSEYKAGLTGRANLVNWIDGYLMQEVNNNPNSRMSLAYKVAYPEMMKAVADFYVMRPDLTDAAYSIKQANINGHTYFMPVISLDLDAGRSDNISAIDVQQYYGPLGSVPSQYHCLPDGQADGFISFIDQISTCYQPDDAEGTVVLQPALKFETNLDLDDASNLTPTSDLLVHYRWFSFTYQRQPNLNAYTPRYAVEICEKYSSRPRVDGSPFIIIQNCER